MKEQIIEKASEMFLAQGFKSVTMDEIASGMGISKKTIYMHFDTKTKLVDEVCNHLYEIISDGIDEIRAMDKDPIEEMYEIKKFVMMSLRGEKSSPIYQLQKYYPEVFTKIKQRQYEKMGECSVQNLKKGIEKDLYRPDIDIDFVFRIYFLGMNGIKDESLFPRQMFPQAKIHEEFLSYHLRGIVTRKGLDKLNKITNGKSHSH